MPRRTFVKIGLSIRHRRKTSSSPKFTVIIATYGRDELIVPTLESVRLQTFTEFEVLVISDGPASESLVTIVAKFDSRFRLFSLDKRSRSQSGPNNFGWELAQGNYIAYLGHDDVWDPHHLEKFDDLYFENPDAHFAVAGCVFIGPPGTNGSLTWVTGIFENADKRAPFDHFFPPSSISHRRQLPDSSPKWSNPETTKRPVDTEFLLGCAENGCTFQSTGTVTVFKFASALRYLSYLCPSAEEQEEMLRLVRDRQAVSDFINERIREAKTLGGYMVTPHAQPDEFLPGEKMRSNEKVRGIALPHLEKIESRVEIELVDEFRGFDWYPIEIREGRKHLRSGPNTRPRLLIPYHSASLVELRIEISDFHSIDIRDQFQIFINGEKISHVMETLDDCYVVVIFVHLIQEAHNILQFDFQVNKHNSPSIDDQSSGLPWGACVTRISLQPAKTALEPTV